MLGCATWCNQLKTGVGHSIDKPHSNFRVSETRHGEIVNCISDPVLIFRIAYYGSPVQLNLVTARSVCSGPDHALLIR